VWSLSPGVPRGSPYAVADLRPGKTRAGQIRPPGTRTTRGRPGEFPAAPRRCAAIVSGSARCSR
jgi:hypothetical protein